MAIELKNLSHKQLDELIEQASQQKVALQRERREEVKAKLAQIARDEGFSIEELFGGRKPRSRTAGTKVAAKYRNPARPTETWSGRGKRPRWFSDALAGGKSEKDLLV